MWRVLSCWQLQSSDYHAVRVSRVHTHLVGNTVVQGQSTHAPCGNTVVQGQSTHAPCGKHSCTGITLAVRWKEGQFREDKQYSVTYMSNLAYVGSALYRAAALPNWVCFNCMHATPPIAFAQLLLPNCICFRCRSPIVSTSAIAPRLSACPASAAAPQLHPF